MDLEVARLVHPRVAIVFCLVDRRVVASVLAQRLISKVERGLKVMEEDALAWDRRVAGLKGLDSEAVGLKDKVVSCPAQEEKQVVAGLKDLE